MSNLHVILASQSPRRRELLTLIGISHDVMPSDIDETVFAGETPIAHSTRLARTKAETIARQYPDSLVIGSDTIVVIDDEILGKPLDAEHATTMLRRLSGRTHTVYTAVAVAHKGRLVDGVESVHVTFRPLDDEAIREYIATGEPMDKAGAYGIQGYGATIVRGVNGDYFAVMGLPLGLMVSLIEALGVKYHYGPLRA